MQVKSHSAVNNEDVMVTPEFRIAVQRTRDTGVQFIVHANGYDSNTLGFVLRGNKLYELGKDARYDPNTHEFEVIDLDDDVDL